VAGQRDRARGGRQVSVTPRFFYLQDRGVCGFAQREGQKRPKDPGTPTTPGVPFFLDLPVTRTTRTSAESVQRGYDGAWGSGHLAGFPLRVLRSVALTSTVGAASAQGTSPLRPCRGFGSLDPRADGNLGHTVGVGPPRGGIYPYVSWWPEGLSGAGS